MSKKEQEQVVQQPATSKKPSKLKKWVTRGVLIIGGGVVGYEVAKHPEVVTNAVGTMKKYAKKGVDVVKGSLGKKECSGECAEEIDREMITADERPQNNNYRQDRSNDRSWRRGEDRRK